MFTFPFTLFDQLKTKYQEYVRIYISLANSKTCISKAFRMNRKCGAKKLFRPQLYYRQARSPAAVIIQGEMLGLHKDRNYDEVKVLRPSEFHFTLLEGEYQ